MLNTQSKHNTSNMSSGLSVVCCMKFVCLTWSMRHAKITTKTFILVKEKCCFEHFLFDVYLLGSIHTELSDSIAEN